MVFENVYWDASWRLESGRFPSILAIGDSWFWANELHPKPRGFRKIADERWHPELWAQGLAS